MNIPMADTIEEQMVEDGQPMGKDRNGALISLGDHRGLWCYTFKQQEMWLQFADMAEDLFSKAKVIQTS